MKKFIYLSLLLISTQTFAGNTVEFDEATEIKCAQEAERLGCQSDDDDHMMSCLRKKQNALTQDCREMFTIRSNNQ